MTKCSIDGQTQLVGLIGWPVAHSLSPVMHNAAFDALGLNWRYVPLPVPPGQLEAAINGLPALGFRGANVTVPHKEAVLPLLHALSPSARAMGAANTLLVARDKNVGQVRGHNTDAQGVRDALQRGGFDPAGRRVVVVGAGGAARAVVRCLLAAEVQEIVLLNRTEARGRRLVADMLPPAERACRLRALALRPTALVERARSADLLVNATPVGMWPQTGASIWPAEVPVPPHLTVFDLVYTPRETRLLAQARAAGATPIGGLEMLLGQGARAFALWTGESAPVKVMRAACVRALEKEGAR
jgi:shikimate dehydrogenase